MTSLLARILLSIMMLPLAVICFFVIFATVAGVTRREDDGIVAATFTTVVLVAAYWVLLWRRSIPWSARRVSLTIAASAACGLAGVLAGVAMMTLARINDETFGMFFGGVFGIVVWLPMTVLLWRETAAERSARIRRSGGDVVSCPRCGYNMTGLYEPRCPECGAKFMLNELYAGQHRDEIADATMSDAAEHGGEPRL